MGLQAVIRIAATWALVVASPALAQGYMTQPVPLPCGTVPSAYTLMGTAGNVDCFVPGNATRPTVVQAARVTTAADGTWSVTWARSFSSANYSISTDPEASNAAPISCQTTAGTKTANGLSGKCWVISSQNVALISLNISLAPANASGVVMNVIGRELTQ